jgi:tetratricopeptide (TPR) repeat protein
LGFSSENIGACFLNLCNYGKAKSYLEAAVRISSDRGWQKRKAWAMMHMGDVYKAQGNYSSANTYYRKAQRIFRNKKDQWGIDFLLIKIGFLLLDMGELQRSRDYIRKALKMATAIGAKYYEVMGLLCLGYISLITQNYAVATDCYERGKEMAEQLGEWALLLQLFILAANIYYYLKKYSKGLTTAHKAIKLAEQMHRKDLYVEVLLGKLKNGMKRGILSKIDSLQILDEAKKIAEEIRCPEILWKVYFEYGAFFQNDKQYHNALEYYQKCNYVFGDVISKIGNEKYKQSYIDRPDRFAVRTAVKEIGDILD